MSNTFKFSSVSNITLHVSFFIIIIIIIMVMVMIIVITVNIIIISTSFTIDFFIVVITQQQLFQLFQIIMEFRRETKSQKSRVHRTSILCRKASILLSTYSGLLSD